MRSSQKITASSRPASKTTTSSRSALIVPWHPGQSYSTFHNHSMALLCRRCVSFPPLFRLVSKHEKIRFHSTEHLERWTESPPLNRNITYLPKLYGSLSKLKLSSLIVATTVAGFQLSPDALNLPLFAWTTAGVALSSFSANTFNQWFEASFDSQMGRTRNRPLPTHQLSAAHAFTFGALAGIAGVGILALKTGWMAATLSGINIALYAAVYTPMKRSSVANTWIGAVVGSIPPMIGFLAGGGRLDLGCLSLGAILYCWQFPHFNALSWNLRADYSRAGYCMASVLNPKLTVDSALRHSLALVPLSALVVYAGICNPWFLASSIPFNLAMIYFAYHFRKSPSRQTARRLFLYSLIHLPLILALMVVHHRFQVDE